MKRKVMIYIKKIYVETIRTIDSLKSKIGENKESNDELESLIQRLGEDRAKMNTFRDGQDHYIEELKREKFDLMKKKKK